MSKITEEELTDLIVNRGLELSDVIDQIIELNSIVGVGLITLSQNVSDYIRQRAVKIPYVTPGKSRYIFEVKATFKRSLTPTQKFLYTGHNKVTDRTVELNVLNLTDALNYFDPDELMTLHIVWRLQ